MLSGFRAGVERGRSAPSAEPHDADRGESATVRRADRGRHPDRHHLPTDSRLSTDDWNDVNSLSTEAANFSWLLGNFVKSVPGVQHTLVVSADGLLMAMSDELDRTQGDQLAAIVSGLSSLTRGAARQLRAGEVRQSIVEMDRLFLFTTSISDGSVLAVAADATCDVGLVGYEMTLLVTRAEATMTPAARQRDALAPARRRRRRVLWVWRGDRPCTSAVD